MKALFYLFFWIILFTSVIILIGFVFFYFYTALILLNKYAVLINKKNMLYQLILKEVSELIILDKTCDHILYNNSDFFFLLGELCNTIF